MKNGEIYAGGLELQFFTSNDFEVENSADASENAAIIARNVLRILMMGWREDWHQIISPQIFQAVFVKRDRTLLQGMRLAFQQGFHSIYEQLNNQPLTALQHQQAQLYISNCLTLLPFSDINPYESIAVPQWINNEWRLVEYKVVPIELTPTNGFKKLFINDEDRVFAYGLEPIHDVNAEPHLLFMGTTYPAGQGFITQINTDLEAFATVGNKLYCSGRQRILDWLNEQQKLVHVCGTSLGGAIALQYARDPDLGSKFSRVDALNPAGIYDSWFKNHLDNWKNLQRKPPVIVQKQGNDPVSGLGVWEDDWDIIQVTPPETRRGPNRFVDHALNYAGFAETTFTGVDTANDNEEHKKRNFWLYTLGRACLYYLGLVPYRYSILPSIRYALSHKTQGGLTCSLIVLFCLLPLLAPVAIPLLGMTVSGILNALIFGTLTGFILDRTSWFLVDCYKGENSSDFSRLLNWLKTQSVIKTVGIVSGAWIFSLCLAALFFGPLLIPVVLAAVATLPLFVHVLYKTNEAFLIVFGNDKIAGAACHDPALPRNPVLDIYRNSLEESFTLQELHDYYYVKRCLLKGKLLIPDSDEKSKVEFKGISKKELLKLDNQKLDHRITIVASKAKIYDITQTVRLIADIGLLASTEGKEIFKEKQAAYSMGKFAQSYFNFG